MANAPRDNNHITAKLGVLCTDGVTLIPISIDPVSGGINVDTVSTIGFTPGSIDFRDANYQPCWMAQNSVDGTPIPIFVNADGAILVDVT
jgi:hypothetical protein